MKEVFFCFLLFTLFEIYFTVEDSNFCMKILTIPGTVDLISLILVAVRGDRFY